MPLGAPLDTRGTFRFLGMVVDRRKRRPGGRTVRRLQARIRAAARGGLSPRRIADLERQVAATVKALAF